jgi:hypothetical protein
LLRLVDLDQPRPALLGSVEQDQDAQLSISMADRLNCFRFDLVAERS